MIRLLEPGLEEDLAKALEWDPLFSVGIEAAFRVYGPNGGQIWLQYQGDRTTAAFLGSESGRYQAAAGPGADLEELASLLRSLPFQSLFGPPALCALLTDIGTWKEAPIMEYEGPISRENHPEARGDAPLKEVYGLLTRVNSWFAGENPFGEWYTFHSHLIRHRLGRVVSVLREGLPVSTATLLCPGKGYALIGSVATDAGHRGRGYAAGLVGHLVDFALERGNTPCLYCGSKSLAHYYAALGFREAGRFAEIERN